MTRTAPETHFASAERTAQSDIEQKASELRAYTLVCNVLDAMPQSVAILDENRQVVATNAQLINTLGEGAVDGLLGRRPGEVLGCANAAAAPNGCGTGEACRWCGAVRAILSAQEGIPATENCQITQEDGNEALDLQVTATPTPIGGRPLTTISIRDIADENRRRILERTFFHDVLNAAGGAWGIANVLNEAETMEEVREFAPLLLHVTEQLIAEVQSQRDLLAAERGDLALQIEDLSCRHLITEVAETYRQHAVAANRTIMVAPDGDDAQMRSSRTLLMRVVGNMVKNALEATPPGGEVTLGYTLSAETICLWVRNPGLIPRDRQLQIFNRSFSTKGEGRGIGTYSMKLLGEKYLGGKVSFESEAETGTRFRICLPRKTPAQPTATDPAPA